MSSINAYFQDSTAHICGMLEWVKLWELIGAEPEDRLLVIGCGEGRLVAMLKNRGMDAVGLDSEPDVVRQAGRSLGNDSLVNLGTPEDLPFEDNTFDVVILTGVLNHCRSPQAALMEAGRVANRRVVAEVINPWSLLGLNNRLNKKATSPRNWFARPALKNLLRSALGPVPLTNSSVLVFPQAWLPWFKELEQSAIMDNSIVGGLLFVAADIRYTRKTRPLAEKVGLNSSRRSVKLNPVQRSQRSNIHEGSLSLR